MCMFRTENHFHLFRGEMRASPVPVAPQTMYERAGVLLRRTRLAEAAVQITCLYLVFLRFIARPVVASGQSIF